MQDKLFIPHTYLMMIVSLLSVSLANTAYCAENKAILTVGVGKQFVLPSIAATFAKDGDIVEIDANGFYEDDTTVWKQNSLTIIGVGGKPKIRSQGSIPNKKAIWVFRGDNITVENIEFINAKVKHHNGAGIRMEGAGLTVRRCTFTDNQNGILTGRNEESDIVIEHSEFNHNGHGDGLSHNLYIGQVRSLTYRFNYSHHAFIGHNLKSRARSNIIYNNSFMDGADGRSSYSIDFSNGGRVIMVGNIIQQGPGTQNSTIVSYGAEAMKYSDNVFYFVNNTVVNDRHYGVFIKIKEHTKGFISNNIFHGKGEFKIYDTEMLNNLLPGKSAHFINIDQYDYRLKPQSKAINAGIPPPRVSGYSLVPEYEYKHKADKQTRPRDGQLDLGALEFEAN